MEIRTLTPAISVSPQISPDDVADIAAAGFKTIICNRPDDEEPGQPAFADIAAAARAAGLEVLHVPVISGMLTEGNVAEFAQALETVPGPVLAYCRSGTRSANLWANTDARKRA